MALTFINTTLIIGHLPIRFRLAFDRLGDGGPVDVGVCRYDLDLDQVEVGEVFTDLALGDTWQSVLPRFTSYDANGKQIGSGLIADPTRIYKPVQIAFWQPLSTVAVIDMASNHVGPCDAISVPTIYSPTVYSSTTNLYLLNSDWSTSTTIDKIDLGGPTGKLRLVAKGSVSGQVLDSYSADEYDGYFRIATTEGYAGWAGNPEQSSNSQNHLFVLKQVGSSFNVVGSINDMAPGEKIYSARFLGQQAFVVTYRSVDPLFDIDLTVPTAPKVAGEVEMPGVSTCLQTVGDGLLVGLGRSVGSDGYYQDPQLSLIDVKNPGRPQLIEQQTISVGRSGGIGIFSDHHAAAYYADQGILTVSVSDETQQASGIWNGLNDLYVYRVDTTAATPGLKLLGKIKHNDSVLRSVEIGDRLISISEESIGIHDFNHPDVCIATLVVNPPLPSPPSGVSFPMPVFPPIVVSLPVGTFTSLPAVDPPESAQSMGPIVPIAPVRATGSTQVAKASSTPAATSNPFDSQVGSWTIQTFVGPRFSPHT